MKKFYREVERMLKWHREQARALEIILDGQHFQPDEALAGSEPGSAVPPSESQLYHILPSPHIQWDPILLDVDQLLEKAEGYMSTRAILEALEGMGHRIPRGANRPASGKLSKQLSSAKVEGGQKRYANKLGQGWQLLKKAQWLDTIAKGSSQPTSHEDPSEGGHTVAWVSALDKRNADLRTD